MVASLISSLSVTFCTMASHAESQSIVLIESANSCVLVCRWPNLFFLAQENIKLMRRASALNLYSNKMSLSQNLLKNQDIWCKFPAARHARRQRHHAGHSKLANNKPRRSRGSDPCTKFSSLSVHSTACRLGNTCPTYRLTPKSCYTLQESFGVGPPALVEHSRFALLHADNGIGLESQHTMTFHRLLPRSGQIIVPVEQSAGPPQSVRASPARTARCKQCARKKTKVSYSSILDWQNQTAA